MSRHRIVVGVDGSSASVRALTWAVHEARRRNGSVRAVTAYEWVATDAAQLAGLGPDGERRRAEDILEAAVAEVRGTGDRLPITREVVLGEPGQRLAEATADADLLVIGDHGHDRLHHAVMGSVAEKCVRHAACPVVIVPAPR
jgi:nucleotide-binding universal stress UspA family protein